MYDDWTTQLYAHKTFANTAKGHTALLLWVKKQTAETIAVQYIMEATGVYHESLAYFLADQVQDVSIVYLIKSAIILKH